MRIKYVSQPLIKGGYTIKGEAFNQVNTVNFMHKEFVGNKNIALSVAVE